MVEVSEGRQRPYYIKALGRDGGVYVRVAGTTRLADEYMIKELLFEGSKSFISRGCRKERSQGVWKRLFFRSTSRQKVWDFRIGA